MSTRSAISRQWSTLYSQDRNDSRVFLVSHFLDNNDVSVVFGRPFGTESCNVSQPHNGVLLCAVVRYIEGSMTIRKSRSYTMRDVARLAGVSVATVSAVANGNRLFARRSQRGCRKR